MSITSTMTTTPVMFDLCCGLGGASAAMRDRGWDVTSFDLLADCKPDVLIDVSNLLNLPRRADLVWASPPCQQFSVHGLPWKNAVKARRDPDLTIVEACYRLITQSQPRFWVIENVFAARKWLTPILGPVASTIDGHVLWGRLPGLIPQFKRQGTKTKETVGPRKLRHQIRSVIPYEISLAIALAVERRLADATSSQP
jgi:hypothetical protein